MTRWAKSAAVLAAATTALFGCTSEPAALSSTPSPTPSPAQLVGTLNPAVTQATIRTTICVAGWTAKVRPPASYTGPLEQRQIRELGLPGGPADYELDHLMPLALGGAPRDPANLRPVPLKIAKQHDVWETRLHRAVCDGSSTLAAAQRQMSEIKENLR